MMQLDAGDIVAIIAAVTSLIGSIGLFLKTRSEAKAQAEVIKAQAKKDALLARKDEVELLRSEVCRLHEDLAKTEGKVSTLEHKYEVEHEYSMRLRDYIRKLQNIMREAGLRVPPMPDPPESVDGDTDADADAKK